MNTLSRFAPAHLLALALAALSTTSVLAAGDDATAPPTPSPTQRCADGQIYDPKVARCVPAKSSQLSDQDRYQAVRELAYAERYTAASLVLDSMTQQDGDQVLTYRGFLLRKTGQFEQAVRVYQLAIARNPNNLLVRSYMGQGFVTTGDLASARRQHEEIVARGGQGTWAEASLRTALSSGTTYSY